MRDAQPDNELETDTVIIVTNSMGSRIARPSIAIAGAGLGGLTAAATLRLAGFDVRVYEQASRFSRIGAGIQMMPNSMEVLRAIGVEARVRDTSFQSLSSANTWMKGGSEDTSWLYGYDAWGAPLSALAPEPV